MKHQALLRTTSVFSSSLSALGLLARAIFFLISARSVQQFLYLLGQLLPRDQLQLLPFPPCPTNPCLATLPGLSASQGAFGRSGNAKARQRLHLLGHGTASGSGFPRTGMRSSAGSSGDSGSHSIHTDFPHAPRAADPRGRHLDGTKTPCPDLIQPF